jgi:hypothetical protein
MKHSASILWLSTLVLLCGCGAGRYSGPTSGLPSTPPAGPTSVPPGAGPNIAGNWQFSATSIAGMPPATIAGSISQSGVSVSGAVHFHGSKCFDRLTTIGLTGTLTGSNISLTSTSVGGQVITFTGSIGDSPTNGTDSALTGTYTVNGGCANGDHGNVTGDKIVMANILRGTFTTSGGETFDVAADEAYFSTPSSEGSFGLEGTVTFRTSCFSSGTITPGTFPSGSFIMGRSVALEIETGNGTVTFLGALNQDRTELSGNYRVVGGTCDQTGTGVLAVSSPWDY